MRAGRIQRQLAAELPAIDEVSPRRETELEVHPAEELRIRADVAARRGASAAAAVAAPVVPALQLAGADALNALATAAQRLRGGIDPAGLDPAARTALAPRIDAAVAMLREAAMLVGLRETAAAQLRTGRRA